MRLLGLHSPCAEGCRERWVKVFSKQGIVWWCITNHSTARTRYREWLVRMGVDVGGRMRRLDESCGELARWKDDLDEYLKRK
ncbi:hypothetical protein JVU11DRAFT_3882 [Chiua virens]|nr:hypothetical protein JVU11DRAFT_3882 [Chiua virens]